MRRHTLVSYDIRHPRRLRRALDTVRHVGRPLQPSVFFCTLSESELVTFEARLRKVIDDQSDQVLFIDLGEETSSTQQVVKRRTLGRPGPARLRRVLVL